MLLLLQQAQHKFLSPSPPSKCQSALHRQRQLPQNRGRGSGREGVYLGIRNEIYIYIYCFFFFFWIACCLGVSWEPWAVSSRARALTFVLVVCSAFLFFFSEFMVFVTHTHTHPHRYKALAHRHGQPVNCYVLSH